MGGKGSKAKGGGGGGAAGAGDGDAAVEIPDMLKLLIVGDTGTGKSTLLRAFLDSGGLQDTKKVDEDYSEIDVGFKGQRIKLQIWDPPETKQKRLSAGQYMKYAGIICVFDIGSGESYDSAKEYWLEQIKCYAPDVNVMLLGNKKDGNREVQTADALKAAQALNCDAYLEASATKGEGVKDAFYLLGECVYERMAGSSRSGKKKKTKRCLTQSDLSRRSLTFADGTEKLKASMAAAPTAKSTAAKAASATAANGGGGGGGGDGDADLGFQQESYWQPSMSRPAAEEALKPLLATKDVVICRPSSKGDSYALSYTKEGKIYHTPVAVDNNNKFYFNDWNGERREFADMGGVVEYLELEKYTPP